MLVSAEDVFPALARLARGAADLRFCAELVAVLSCILLTAPELHDLRCRLRNSPQVTLTLLCSVLLMLLCSELRTFTVPGLRVVESVFICAVTYPAIVCQSVCPTPYKTALNNDAQRFLYLLKKNAF